APRPDGDRPGARAEGRGGGQQLRLDLLAALRRQLGAGRGQQEARLDPGRQAGGKQVLALGREQLLALAVLALPQLANQFQLGIVVGSDHRSVVRSVRTVPETTKRAVLTARPGKFWCRSPSGGGTLPGYLHESAKGVTV